MGGLLLGGGVERKPNRHKLNRKECAMKLTSAQVERTLTQFRGEAIPDNHPVIPQLKGLFGEHTFFLDSNGLRVHQTDLQADYFRRGRGQNNNSAELPVTKLRIRPKFVYAFRAPYTDFDWVPIPAAPEDPLYSSNMVAISMNGR